MPTRNYYQANQKNLKDKLKLGILISLLRKKKRVKSIIEIGIVI